MYVNNKIKYTVSFKGENMNRLTAYYYKPKTLFLLLTFTLASIIWLSFLHSKQSMNNSYKKVHGLVSVTAINPNIRTHILYATPHNFTGKVLYKKPICYLLEEVALQLSKIQQALEKQGLGLLVTDAYRPPSVQWALWNAVPDPRYVADPRKGGKHTRGTTVDLTLIRLSDGKQLEMGTEVDEFSQKSWLSYNDLSEQAKRNRQLLQDIMKKHGFMGIPREWWHFDYKGWELYPVLDIDFDELV